MGQRSQIYIRYNVNDKSGQNYKGLIQGISAGIMAKE